MTGAPRIAFAASGHPRSVEALAELERRYGSFPRSEADVLVALGGDGFMLHTLHENTDRNLPVFGMHLGEVGFLMNRYAVEDLPDRIARATSIHLAPLRMRAGDLEGGIHDGLAINEVALLRQTNQAAHIRIIINGVERVPQLVADGVLLATTAGSTAYNLSAHGPILPLGTQALALTPISPFRPRRWRGAVLPSACQVRFDVLQAERRPVSATADYDEVRNVEWVDVVEAEGVRHQLLFDPEHSLDERILAEQFA